MNEELNTSASGLNKTSANSQGSENTNNANANNINASTPNAQNNLNSNENSGKDSVDQKNDTENNKNKDSNNKDNPKDNTKDSAKEDTKDATKEGAKDASESAQGSNPAQAAKSVKGAVDATKDTAKELSDGDLYNDEKSGLDELADDAKDVTVGTAEAGVEAGLAVGSAFAGDVSGAVSHGANAVKHVVKIIPAILRILLPILFLIIMLTGIILSAPAMIWGSITKEYEDWAYAKAVNAVNLGISHAAFAVVDDVSDDIEEFTGITDFRTKCNKYYENYAGDGYEYDFDDGTLSISLQYSADGCHQDSHIKWTTTDGDVYKVIYKGADITTSEVESDVSYSEIICAFNMYRENKAKNDKVYKVFHVATSEIQNNIVTLGQDALGKLLQSDVFSTISDGITSALKIDTPVSDDELQEVYEFTQLTSQDDAEDVINNASDSVWGMADTASIYYYMMTDEDLYTKLYDYTITDANKKESKISDITAKNDSGEYEMTIDVKTFSTEDAETDDGQKYSSSVMNAFGITNDKDIEKVVGTALISDALIEVKQTEIDDKYYSKSKDETYDNVEWQFQKYMTVSQSKTLYEYIAGGPSVLESLLESGIYADMTEARIRSIIANYSETWIEKSKTMGVGTSKFLFPTEDEFTNSFMGTSAGWKYDNTTGEYKQNEKKKFNEIDRETLLAEDGTFATYVFSRTINVGQMGLKPRTYIFPEYYKNDEDPKKSVSQMYTSDDYYNYFQKYAINGVSSSATKNTTNAAYYQLSKFSKGPDWNAWGNAFDTSLKESTGKNKCIEKGDLLFFTYWGGLNIDDLDLDDVKAILDGGGSAFDFFYKDKGYQVGVVNRVNYKEKKIYLSVYNFDKDPVLLNPIESTFSKKWDAATNGMKVEQVVIKYNEDDLSSSTIEPAMNEGVIYPKLETLNSWIDQVNSTLPSGTAKFAKLNINQLTFVSGYAKPDYQAFVDEYNKRLEPIREEYRKSLADAAIDLGGGTFGYPTGKDYRKISAGFPNYSSGKYHGGIDFPCPPGTPIYAAESGKVTTAKNLNYSYGHYLVIDHGNGYSTLYAHNTTLLVGVGDRVTRGQVIAYSGSTGNSTGPHCHFEVRKNGTQIDPKPLLTDTPTFVYKSHRITLNTPITKSPINNKPIEVTFYDSCPKCNGSNAGITASGLKLTNTKKYYDENQAYVACNWLPIGTKISITFAKNSSLGSLSGSTRIYTVQDTGSKTELNTHRIDVYIPNEHKVVNAMGSSNHSKDCTSVTIISKGKGK